MTSPLPRSLELRTTSRAVGKALTVTALALAAGAVLLATSADAIQPASRPSEPDAALLVGAWWLAAALLAWWTLSMASWVLALSTSRQYRATARFTNRSPDTRPGEREHRRSGWRPSLDRFTAPGTRRLAEGLLAVGLVALPACSPGDSVTSSPTLVFVEEVATTVPPTTAPPTTAPPTTAPTTAPPTTTPSTNAPTSTSEPAIAQEPSTQDESSTSVDPTASAGETNEGHDEAQLIAEAASTHEVVAGDNLWAIAEAHLTAELGERPPTSEVAAHWRRLIAQNRDRLLSGEPDLIHPGERIRLPAVAGR